MEKEGQNNLSLSRMEELRFNTEQSKLIWKDFNYYIPTGNIANKLLSRCVPGVSREEKQILNEISGYAEPGKFLAIIGPSGAGKTTLLNILCRRMRIGRKEGEMTLNGKSLNSSSYNEKYTKAIGYVLQHDALLPFLTVYETLMYSGMLTLPNTLSTSMKIERINEIMNELGLTKVKNDFVGNELVRGISGGEKKRLSIAIELLRSPCVLFLDEPTSGLDAKNALRLCENLASLAHKYKYTVITTIHQPRAQIFNQFDNLLILAGGGKQIYFGPANNTLDYFGSQGLECPIHENPADFFIDCVTVDYKDAELQNESKERVEELNKHWEETSNLKDMDPFEQNDKYSFTGKVKSANFLQQIFWILYRENLNEVRNSAANFARVAQSIFMAVVLGILYFQIDTDQSTVADRNGLFFFIIINASFNETMPTIAAFAMQRVVFFRERDSRTYSILAYWIAKQMSMLFLQLAIPSVYCAIIYWMVGFQSDWYKFFIFYTVVVEVALITGSVGMIMGSSLPPTPATVLSPIFIIVSMIFSGFLVNIDNIPSFIRWLQWLSFGKYAFDALIQNEYNGLDLYCKSDQEVGDTNVCPFTSGEEVIDSLNITEIPIPIDMVILFGMFVFYRLVLIIAFAKARPTGN